MSERNRSKFYGWSLAQGMWLVLAAGCNSSTLPVASSTPSTPPQATMARVDLPDDPLELARASLEALAEKVRLISLVQDLETAKSVSNQFPQVARQQRLLDEKLGNRLIPKDVQQQIDQQFTSRRRELDAAWSREYVRVAFLPGVWEQMHPELVSVADLTVLPEDAAGLEREATRLLTQATQLSQQVTDIPKALELSPQYRVATARIAPVLARLNVARGGSGVQENQPPQVRQLGLLFDAERQRLGSIPGAFQALHYGEVDQTQTAIAAVSSPDPKVAEAQQLLVELRSQEVPRMRNAMLRLGGLQPGPFSAEITQELIGLLDVEQLRGSAVEALKHGWLPGDKIPAVREAMARIDDRGLKYNLAEVISRMPSLDQQTIEFLAAIIHESPGDAVRCLRNVGPAAEPVVLTYVSDSSREVRKAVCETLRDIGSSASLPALESLVTDADRGVAEKAREAIREIGKPVEQRPHLRNRS